FDRAGHEVVGIDNNMRKEFFGPSGDTTWNLERLRQATRNFRPHDLDIRDRPRLADLFKQERFDLIVHCAAQPSHDKAKDLPLVDFDVNAVGTINLLETTRLHCPEAVFILMSTNKVYGDAPNEVPLKELPTRWDYARPEDYNGICEDCRIDRTLHSLFGASKTAGDVVAQEYGRYFGMKVGVFRGGCLTGEHHSGVQLHGFLSYLFKVAVAGGTYNILGYKGKQVRDQIHSTDVIAAFVEFAQNPRPGEVYNLGGGRQNSASILECVTKIEALLGRPMQTQYVDEARVGDHICYISDLSKFQSHYPNWRITRSLDQILESMAATMA
ncbi:MAG: NAD-dependent epimerase/dehydratase family protein, partial [Verrucomicrobiae bacterium]|nr:NAD-dependent epimerase/dehydratase family protein [Verrucomicrobiae bacterium]